MYSKVLFKINILEKGVDIMNSIIKKFRQFFYRNIENNITYNEFLKINKEHDKVFLIDVRSMQEYNEGHLNNAICIPLYELNKRIINIVHNKESIIVLYCSSGIRSVKAKKVLENMGFINIYNIKGGLDEIKNFNF